MKSYKNIAILFLVVSALGFIDATYLSVQHFLGEIPPCTISGCEFVLTSAQSTIFGVPVALFGSFYYLFILILSVYHLDTKNKKILKTISLISVLGFIVSIYFVYLQFFVIKYICEYCMVSAITCTIMFILGMYYLYKIKKEKTIENFTI